jgi:NADH-quinone oxidoreductase subunit A
MEVLLLAGRRVGTACRDAPKPTREPAGDASVTAPESDAFGQFCAAGDAAGRSRRFGRMAMHMLSDYAPILLFLGVCLAFAVLVQGLNVLVGPRQPSPEKELPYECGIMPVESARRRFSVSFYVTAMLFIIFDVESIFLFPWATVVRDLRIFGLVEIGIFIFTLVAALAYVWRKGALEWD